MMALLLVLSTKASLKYFAPRFAVDLPLFSSFILDYVLKI